MDKMLIKVHSMVDVITNSSTELFCYVKDKTYKQVDDILKSILDDFGCDAVDFYIDDDVWLWDEEKGEEYQEDGVLEIGWQYETKHYPCTMILDRLKEVFKDNLVNK